MNSTPYTPTRRQVLTAGAGLGAAMALAGCGLGSDTGGAVKADRAVKAEVDGDLVYFNWADYLDPSVLKGFKKKYGVKIITSNYDSMESMQAKMSAGNRYDVIFPSAQWVEKLAAAGQLLRIDHSLVPNSTLIFDHYRTFADPWYDANSAHSIPFSMYKTGLAWRKDKLGDQLTGSWNDLWNRKAKKQTYLLDDRDEVLGMLALLLDFPLNTAKPAHLEAMVQKASTLRPYLRGFSSTDYRNLLSGNAWIQQTWSGDMAAVLNNADDPSIYGFESPKEGTPVNSDCYAIPANAAHPGTALLFINYLLEPENVIKNMQYIGYPMPVHGTEKAYEKIVADFPECKVTLSDLSDELYFDDGSVAQTRRRSDAWTSIKVG
ncbi:MAG TPA: spermidine/putrescine ABC transporter substrate-binding protein [Segeticoccus sp.]|nr:spermidine/putrescine ABC transporter substrate-binding protein [Segeticoccus sp.]